ncbi:MAG TPA: AAA family ATPase [Gemmatimonadaceae bacterium]|nr:AAA family ATPase [Gemmatimonadaceae bacterium]
MLTQSTPLASFPLVGRSEELASLAARLDAAESGRGGTLFLVGEGGVGKTRLVKTLSDRAEHRGWCVAIGRAYPVETGVPYAPFSDALLPILRGLDAAAISLLTRGGSAELQALFPALGERALGAMPRGDPAEVKARLLWTFTQFLSRLAARKPLLLVLENLQWADASSLELLHFAARQVKSDRILLLCTYNEAERDHNPALRTTEQSLVALACATVQRLAPLSREAIDELVRRVFGVEGTITREFTALLYGWTRGNPFFVEETLKALVESGRLHEREGTWLGWELEGFDLPRSVRDVVVARIDRLSPPARTIANLAAVIGTRASFDALHSVSALPRVDLIAALDELRQQRVLVESADSEGVVYDFAHPLLQQTVYGELGLARARLLHATVAEALEGFYGTSGLAHADELAFHFARADASSLAPKAARYLTAAGRTALSKNAAREAVNYLAAALEQIDRLGLAATTDVDVDELVDELARARQRLGEYDAAIALWMRARASAERAGRRDRVALVERRLGIAHFWSGRYAEALAHYDAGIDAAREDGDDAIFARLRLAKGLFLQELGRLADATAELESVLRIAERLGDASLLARAHRGLMTLYIFTGPVDVARGHGERALELAEATGNTQVLWSVHLGMAHLRGLTGNAPELERHLAEAERLADELRSPLLRVWTGELAIQVAEGKGDWDAAVALGERTIALARTFGQTTMLPRMLVWSSMLYLGRGEYERAKQYIDEAWTMSGAGDAPTDRPLDVHSIIPAHTALAAYYRFMGEHEKAIDVAEAGLAIADRTGYVVWAVHRLLPVMGESALLMNDLALAQRVGARLRRDATRLEHRLGLAWADACDALVAMIGGEHERAVGMLRAAVDELESVPYVGDAARLRRQLARVLMQMGERDEAMRELRKAHDVFARLGAVRQLDATREHMRELGARLPARAAAATAGAEGLTGREVEIIRLVAARKSNKEIAKALGISPRTVSTHLSNIFAKVDVSSRGELADFARRTDLPSV